MISGNENEVENEKQIKNIRDKDLCLDMEANILKNVSQDDAYMY